MTADSAEATEHGDGETSGETWERVTAPQQAYSARDVGIGIAVAAISLVVTFGVPLAFTL